MAFTRWNKVWLVSTLCSALAYDLYWLRGASIMLVQALSLPLQDLLLQLPRFLSYTVPVWTGGLLRFIGFSIALLSAYMVWRPKPKPFSSAKKYVSIALLFEGTYFLLLLPTNVIRIIDGESPFILYFAFLLQILLAWPFLTVLGIKIWRYKETAKANVLKWSSVAAIGYLTGIWINNVFRWLSMTETEGMVFILSGITSLGFLNSIITLSSSLILAVVGLYALSKKKSSKSSTILIAFALIMLGLHFVIFIIYSTIANSLKWVPLVEIWPITLLGLGLSLLTAEKDLPLEWLTLKR